MTGSSGSPLHSSLRKARINRLLDSAVRQERRRRLIGWLPVWIFLVLTGIAVVLMFHGPDEWRRAIYFVGLWGVVFMPLGWVFLGVLKLMEKRRLK
jgi:hypothetical protein